MKTKKIKWTYCECGCHGSDAYINNLYYWMYDDLRGDKPLHLKYNGQGIFGESLGWFKTIKELNKVAREHAKKITKERSGEDE